MRKLVILLLLLKALEGFAQDKPNIVFILADDLGWVDLGCYGSEYYDTPNIDQLAANGMRFTNAYSANPLCSPTRASILSGQYPGRFHLTSASGHLKPNESETLKKDEAPAWHKVITPGTRNYMPLETITIAENLKKAGYTTGFIGKWHLGHSPYNPENQGFDYNLAGGPNPGPPSYFSPYGIANLPNGPANEYITDRVTEEALDYIEANKDTNFFLCLWEFAVHAPFHPKLEFFERYQHKTDPMGRQGNPVMAALIKSLDESVGKVLKKLEELDLAEETLVVFFSDNGGNVHSIVNGNPVTNNFPLRSGKGSIYEGGNRVPLIVSWPGKIRPGSISEELVISMDFYPTFLEVSQSKADKVQILDGVSILPVLTKGKTLKRKSIFVHFPHYIQATNNFPATFVRKGKWKLIRVYGEGIETGNSYQLYNLKNDIGEQRNMADIKPKKVKKMDALIDDHLDKIGANLPVTNPAFDPNAPHRMGEKKIFPAGRMKMY